MRRVLAAILLGLAGGAGAGGLQFDPEAPYYFEHFDPAQRPWLPGQELNIEEVFKNYQYYEIRFARNRREIQVTRFIQNSREGVEYYRIQPDGGLEKWTPSGREAQ